MTESPAQPSAPDDPGPGGGQDARLTGHGTDPAEPAFPPPTALWRRGSARWIAGTVLTALILVGALVLQHLVTARPQAGPALPGKLLGWSKNPDGPARDVARQFGALEARAGKVVHVVDGAYVGTRPGGFVVAAGLLCRTCAAGTAAAESAQMTAAGAIGARSFPPGPYGGWLVCGGTPKHSLATIVCNWDDNKAVGTVAFFPPAGPAAAAAQTNQIRAAIEN
jgi:hypothetical protein